MKCVLEKVQDYADRAHGDQLRKYSSDRYIVHPIRVMQKCQKYFEDVTILSAAILHDVLEDTEVSEGELYQFLSTIMDEAEAIRTTQLTVELTDIYTKTKYPRWNRKKRKRKEAQRLSKVSAEAQTIKYADIIDNCKEISIHDPHFAKRFLPECHQLLQQIRNGNLDLWNEANDTIHIALKML
jgi:(p)ppGpp synthase/HD superfamily hydrolase